MSTTAEALDTNPLAGTTEWSMRPRFEGCNICTWIGFKHVVYLVEEAVLEHFRNAGYSPRQLFEDHGLCLEIVDSNTRILHALHLDDDVSITVAPTSGSDDEELNFSVTMHVDRDGSSYKAVVSKVAVVIKQDDSPVTNSVPPTPVSVLAPYTVEAIRRPESRKRVARTDLTRDRGSVDPKDDVVRQLVPKDANTFVWRWHIPYFYCHFNERLQHSGYLRLMEEVEDLFLADRGISIRTMLHDKGWIPVVPDARVEMLEEAYMEEPIYVVYRVEDIFREYTYRNRMDCYVLRDGRLIRTATGHITHGYAEIGNRRDWSLVAMDEPTLAALRNEHR